MSRGMVSFLAGLGSGYIKAKDKAYDQERQAKQDAWLEEQRNRLRQEWGEADAVKAGIKDASATRELSTGTVTEAGGQKLFSADPGQAAQVKSMVDSIAELEGSAPATQTGGYAVTGQMSKGHQIGTGAAPDVATLNTPDAESQRVQDVYRKAGMRDKAMAEFTANEAYKKAIRDRITTMETEGVSKALGLLRMGAPEQAMEAFQKSGSVKLPEGSKFVQADGTDMFTGQPGKVWSVVGPDGKTIVADVGLAGAQYLGIADQFKFDGDLAKNRQTQANADRTYELDKTKANAQADYYRAAAGAKEAGPANSYERMSEVDRKTLEGIQDEKKQYRTAILNAEAGGMADPEAVKRMQAKLGALALRERSITSRYESAPTIADPQGLRAQPATASPTGPTNTSERVMAQQVQGGMGADPAAIQREIDASTAGLAQVKTDAERKMLNDHIANMRRQLANVGGATKAPAAEQPKTVIAKAQAPKPAPKQEAPSKSMGEYLSGMFSGGSQAQINGIKDKLARGLPLSGTEVVLAQQSGLIRAR